MAPYEGFSEHLEQTSRFNIFINALLTTVDIGEEVFYHQKIASIENFLSLPCLNGSLLGFFSLETSFCSLCNHVAIAALSVRSSVRPSDGPKKYEAIMWPPRAFLDWQYMVWLTELTRNKRASERLTCCYLLELGLHDLGKRERHDYTQVLEKETLTQLFNFAAESL